MVKLKHNKYLVTGAAGFIGSHIAEEIVKQGKQVICIDNMVAGKKENLEGWWDPRLCTMVEANIAEPLEWNHHLRGVDIVFHNAASKCTVCRENPSLDLRSNALGSFCVFDLSRKYGVKKVIHASTGSVFQGKPKSFYGVSKLAGESYLRAFKEYYPDFRFTSIRYHHIYGPRQESGKNGGVVAIFIKNLLEGKPLTIYGDGEQQRHFTYVEDVVDWNFRCETEFDGEFIDLAEPMPITINQLASLLGEIIDRTAIKQYAEAKKGDIRTFNVSSSVIPEDINSIPRLVRNLKETIAHYASRTKVGKSAENVC